MRSCSGTLTSIFLGGGGGGAPRRNDAKCLSYWKTTGFRDQGGRGMHTPAPPPLTPCSADSSHLKCSIKVRLIRKKNTYAHKPKLQNQNLTSLFSPASTSDTNFSNATIETSGKNIKKR